MKHKSRTMVIRANLIDWYDELDNVLHVDYPGFPPQIRSRILQFGEYEVERIDRFRLVLAAKKHH